MSKPITQQIPWTLVAFALGANVMNGQPGFASSNAATLEWKTSEELPTQCSPAASVEMAGNTVDTAGLTMLALARLAIPDSRPMEAQERKHADDFFWSHFA